MSIRSRVRVEVVDANNLVVCARGQVLVVAGEADGVYGARVCADGSELPGLCIAGVI
jgi:hypothetical protein